jgi:hypothetical protein
MVQLSPDVQIKVSQKCRCQLLMQEAEIVMDFRITVPVTPEE